MKKIITILFLLVTLFSEATTYYISPSGNDITGDGTIGNPWKTLSKATTSVTTAGDIIHVNTGTYNETVQCTLSAGVSIEGVDSSNTIITSVFLGLFTEFLNCRSAENTNGNQHISNLRFDGNKATFSAIHIAGRRNFEIYNCSFRNYTDGGVWFTGRNDNTEAAPTTYATGNKFYNNRMVHCANYVHDFGGSFGYFGLAQLNFGGQTGMLVYNNYFDQQTDYTWAGDGGKGVGWCIKYASGGYTKGCKIYNNTFLKIPYQGTYAGDGGWDFAIEIFRSNGMEIYNNTSQGSFDFNHDWDVDPAYSYNLWIHDNTISQTALTNYAESGIIFEVEARNVIVERNTIYNVNWGVILSILGTSTGFNNIVIKNNLMYNLGRLGGDGGNGIGVGSFSRDGINYYLMDSLFVYNNTMVAASGNAPFYGIRISGLNAATSTSVTNTKIKNNIVQGFNGYWMNIQYADYVDNTEIQYNDTYNNGGSNAINIPFGTPTNYTANNQITGNPTFVGGSNYTLQAGSPCIDAGTNVGITYYGAAPDIGYWEYNSGNASPTANAGADSTVAAGRTTCNLLGSGTDIDGTITGYLWEQISGPSLATINSPTSQNTLVSVLIAGTYVFRLTVTDNSSATGTDNVTVTVLALVSNLERIKRKLK